MTVAAFQNTEPTKIGNVISELVVGAGSKMGLCRKRLGALGDISLFWVTFFYLKRMKG